MQERLTIHFRINGRDYDFKSPPEEEVFLRNADKLIRERIEFHKGKGVRDSVEIMTVVAFECLVANLKSEEQARQTQNRVYDKIAQLNKTVTDSLP